ncbi:unnamed protein product, partial [Allacma fusca]
LDKCTLLITNPPGKTEYIWTDVQVTTSSTHYVPKLLLPIDDRRFLTVPQLSTTCMHVIILIHDQDQVIAFNISFKQATLRNYVFVGNRDRIDELLENKTFLRLQFKMGIVTSTDLDAQAQVPVRKLDFLSDRQIIDGQNLRIAIFPFEPNYIRESQGDPQAGFCFTLIQNMMANYNFTTKYYFTWGRLQQYPNGTWGGPLGDLLYDRLDVYVALTHTYERNPWVWFTSHMLFINYYFLTSHPQKIIKWEATFYPFDFNAWLLIFVTVLLTSIIFVSNFKQSTYVTIFERITFAFYVMLQQCVTKLPKPSWLAIMFIFYSTIIVCCYNCNLVSYLTFPAEEVIPRNAEELADATDYRTILMYLPGGAGDSYFKLTKSPKYVSLRERFIYERDFLKCVMEAALNPKTACICWDIVSSGPIAKNLTLNSAFVPLRGSLPILSTVVNLALPQGSKFFGLFHHAVGWLQNTGHFDKWRQDSVDILIKRGKSWLDAGMNESLYQKLDKAMLDVVNIEIKALDFRSFVVPFTLILFGTVVGCGSFIIELTTTKLKGVISGFNFNIR